MQHIFQVRPTPPEMRESRLVHSSASYGTMALCVTVTLWLTPTIMMWPTRCAPKLAAIEYPTEPGVRPEDPLVIVIHGTSLLEGP